jgi:predicted GNAT family acetyltransferase
MLVGGNGRIRGPRDTLRLAAPKPFLISSHMNHTIKHQESQSGGAFHIQQGAKRVAEMTYSRTNASLIIIDHTDVDPSLGGQGVGRSLLDALVTWARATNTKVVALCPFAKAQFNKDPSIRDVLV